jgi:hypothetical protein
MPPRIHQPPGARAAPAAGCVPYFEVRAVLRRLGLRRDDATAELLKGLVCARPAAVGGGRTMWLVPESSVQNFLSALRHGGGAHGAKRTLAAPPESGPP